MKRLFRAFLKEERGSVTVEFVIIFPLLALWLGASFVFFDAYKTTSQAAKAAYTLADMVSRQPVVTDTYVGELYQLQEKLLPRTPSGKWLRVTSIQYFEDPDTDGDGEPDKTYYKVLWSRAKPLVVDKDGSTNEITDDEIPVDVIPEMAANDTVILLENFVPYSHIPVPLLSELNFTGLEWRNSVVVRPRFSGNVSIKGPSYSRTPPTQVASAKPPPRSGGGGTSETSATQTAATSTSTPSSSASTTGTASNSGNSNGNSGGQSAPTQTASTQPGTTQKPPTPTPTPTPTPKPAPITAGEASGGGSGGSGGGSGSDSDGGGSNSSSGDGNSQTASNSQSSSGGSSPNTSSSSPGGSGGTPPTTSPGTQSSGNTTAPAPPQIFILE